MPGSLVRDEGQAHRGKGSCQLDADFRGGEVYVGGWRHLRSDALPDIREFHLWLHGRGVRRLGVQLVDDAGECHQRRRHRTAA